METSLSSRGHICTNLGIPKAGDLEEQEELIDRETFTYLKNKKYTNFSSLQKFQDFRFLNGTIHHVIVNGVV